MNVIQFPALGLEFTINRVAFTLLGVDVYWYGIILATGLLLGMVFAFHYASDFGIDSDRLVDVVFIGTIMAIICARIYYVAFVPYDYSSIWEMLGIRDGGIGIYGALVGAFVFGGLACRWRKIPLLATFDLVSMGFLIGQGIGRWGNFVNQEAFGTNTTLPWGMYSQATASYLASHQELLAQEGMMVNPSLPVHPTFLYESITCLAGFLIFWALMKKRRYNGQLFVWYLIWNGANRFWIEGLRTDSLMFSVELNLRSSQVLALGMVLFGIVVEIYMRRKGKGQLQVPLAISSAALKKLAGKEETTEFVHASLPASASHKEFVSATAEMNESILKDNIEQEEPDDGSSED